MQGGRTSRTATSLLCVLGTPSSTTGKAVPPSKRHQHLGVHVEARVACAGTEAGGRRQEAAVSCVRPKTWALGLGTRRPHLPRRGRDEEVSADPDQRSGGDEGRGDPAAGEISTDELPF